MLYKEEGQKLIKYILLKIVIYQNKRNIRLMHKENRRKSAEIDNLLLSPTKT